MTARVDLLRCSIGIAAAALFAACAVTVKQVETTLGPGYELRCTVAASCRKRAAELCERGYEKVQQEAQDEATKMVVRCSEGGVYQLPPPPLAPAAAPELSTSSRIMAPPEITRMAMPSVVTVVTDLGQGEGRQGSGFAVAPEAVATNAHVVRGAKRIGVKTGNARWYEVRAVLAYDIKQGHDLALLQVPDLGITALVL